MTDNKFVKHHTATNYQVKEVTVMILQQKTMKQIPF